MINKAPYIVKSLLKGIALLCFPVSMYAQPFLWEIESDPPSYLFGTVHSAHPLVSEIPKTVTDALNQSRSFHPELEFTPQAMGEMTSHLFRMDNPNLQPRLPAELWERLRRNAARAGIPEPLLQKIPLELAALPFTTRPGTDFDRIVDVQLSQRALSLGIGIHALETFAEQVDAFKTLTEEEAVLFLEQTLQEFENGFPAKMKILEIYSAGDLDALYEEMEAEFEKIGSEKLLNVFLKDRNKRMVERMLPYIEKGGAFVAVGVGHMAGEENIIELLEKEGFRARRAEP